MSQINDQERMSPFTAAGICAGVAGLLTFLIIHHFWIKPIWFIAPFGLIIAGLGGLAIGRSYAILYTALPRRPWTFLAVTIMIAIILAPAILLAQLRPPLIDVVTFKLLPQGAIRAAINYTTELLATSIVMGAAVGWLVGRSRHAMITTAIAGFAYALGPGHNIPALGNTPAAGEGLVLLLIITLISTFVLVEVSTMLLKRKTKFAST